MEEIMENNDKRRQINIRLERELYDFLVAYAKDNYKTVTAVVREMIAGLYKEYKSNLIMDENGNPIIKGK